MDEMIKLNGKNGESFGMNFEPAEHGWDLGLKFDCDFTTQSKLAQRFQTFAYRKPHIEELISLTLDDQENVFEFDALQFGMKIERCQLGVHDVYVVNACCSTVIDIDYFPWPNDELEWIILGKKPLAKLEFAFSFSETELFAFYSALKQYFELNSGP